MSLEAYFGDAKRRVQSRPSDMAARSALWQVFAARGEFDRAQAQLDAMVVIDGSWAREATACGGLLQAEAQRLRVLGGAEPPVCMGDPPPWLADMVAGLSLAAGSASADRRAAAALLHRAQLSSPACVGSANGQPLSWLCDGDARLGPCLEVVVQGRYFWVPWSRVRALNTRPPTEIRDRLWLHALVTLEDELSIEAFLPARYPAPGNDAEHLGQRTEWHLLADDVKDVYVGRGQKTLLADSGEWGLLELRELRLQGAAAP
jgi:type VI secretion system protein ImpE